MSSSLRSFWLAVFACSLTLSVPVPARAQSPATELGTPHAADYDLRAHFRDVDGYANAATQLYVTSVLLLVPSALGAALGAFGLSFSSTFHGDEGPSWMILAAAIAAGVGHLLTMTLAITYDVASSVRRRDAMDHLPAEPCLIVAPSIAPDGAGLSARVTF